jgi:hypothetical protein
MKILSLWNNYWFRPSPLLNLAVARIFIAGFQTLYLVWKNIPEELIEAAALPDSLYAPLPVLRLLLLPFGPGFRPPLAALIPVFWITLVAGILSVVGLRTNLSLGVFALGNLSLQAYDYSFGDYHHPEALMLITLAILALSPAGRVLSLDDSLQQRRIGSGERAFKLERLVSQKGILARWPLLLVQWMYVLIYLSAGLSKLGSAGLDWTNGYTLQYYLVQDGLRWGSDLAIMLAQNYNLAVFLGWAAVLFESTFFLVMIFPFLALLYIPGGVAMHTVIYLTQRAPFPEFIVIYVVFVPWALVLQWLSQRSSLRLRTADERPI